ncbi:MAG: replicative DNA helicase [Gemmatimonadaceae bacterium]
MSSSPVEFTIPQPKADPFRDRRPPYSEDAEQAVLSAMLLDADAMSRAAELVDETMFYREPHRRIFKAMVTLQREGAAVDPLTLSNELDRMGSLEAVGGKDYLGTLIDIVPTAANVEHHCKIVKEKALRRRLIEVATGIVTEAYEGQATSHDLIDMAEHKILEVGKDRGAEGFVRIKNLLWSAMERIDLLRASGGDITGVTSGFPDLDKMTLGFQRSDLIIIAARPSMGKTAFVLNIAQNAAIERNVPVAVFSLEMSREQLLLRMLASEGRVDAQRIRSGKLTPDDDAQLARAAGFLGNAPIWVDDSPGLSVYDIRSRARRLKASADVGLIIVDYLQLISSAAGVENRTQEISQISRALKMLAKEIDTPVIALSQLSRSVEQRTDKRPLLSDLRESGSIEQDADVVMFIYRPEYYEGAYDEAGNPRVLKDTNIPLDGLAEVIISKQRNGPTGMARLNFRKQFTRFESYTARTQG